MKVLLTATVQSHICQFHKPLVEVLHEHGCEVHVAARDNLAEKNGLKLDFVEKVFNVSFARSPKSKDNLHAFKELKRIINEEDYDVIHCNTPMGGIVTRLAAKKARKNGTKIYYTAHGFHFYKGAPKKNWVIYYPIEKIFSRMTDKLITITKEDYELAKRKFHCEVEYIHGVGVDTKKIGIIPIDEKKKIKKDLGVDENTKIILNIGELLPNKNQKTLIKAIELVVNRINNCKLLIAGNGRERESLEQLIKERKLEPYIIWLGYTTKINQYLNVCDVLVACSYREGLPLNLVEAMLCGKPIVASINRGHRELVKNDVNGYLVSPDDPQDFSEKICEVLQGHKDYIEVALKMADAFTDKNVKLELESIYNL